MSEAEVISRREQFGSNNLAAKKKKSPFVLFLLQFKDFMILILIAAALISGIIGDLTDTIIILIIVVLNAVIGFVQEYKAEKAIDALKKMEASTAKVIRSGQTIALPIAEIVPGDIVEIEAGTALPADIRLVETHSLRVDESALTGESMAVDKHAETLSEEELPLAERFNMAYKSTLVINGRALGIVVATGMKTEIGKIAELLQVEELDTPLKQRMGVFSKKLSYLILLICAALFGTGILRGEDPLTMLLLSISLAVAAIPEALPALITIALAKGAKRLARQKALVRKLPAVETLGSISFICSDKTGTLTLNKMKVVNTESDTCILPGGEDDVLMLAMMLNHDVKMDQANALSGDPTEEALVHAALESFSIDRFREIVNEFPRVAELPFDSDRKCMTTVHTLGDQFLILTKGASESIAGILNDSTSAKRLIEQSESWAKEGQRVLAFAWKIVDELPTPFSLELVETDMSLAGSVGMIDPPREQAKQAIAECRQAGIKPVMITGDHPATAQSIARSIGILQPGDLIFTGAELNKLDDEAFTEKVEQVSVYARVSPEQKLRIVHALQRRGHFVAMTGDGVNDAPSLKAANIGVAMGINGTDVSKEASQMILLDDDFATIVKAVKEGRRIYDNIRKFVKYIMTCNSAEIWTIFMAPILGLPIPLLPVHILWINLVTDGLPGLALASEKAEDDIMERPPRPSGESLFAGGMIMHIIWVGILMAGLTIGVQAWAIHRGVEHWQTIVFTVLSLAQLGQALAVRSERTPLYRQGLFSNKMLMGAILLTFALQMAVIYIPALNTIFKTQPLSWDELLLSIGIAAVLFHAVELEKWFRSKRRKNAQTL